MLENGRLKGVHVCVHCVCVCVSVCVCSGRASCCLLWQNLESLSFGSHGDEFISAHIDGSYTVWKLSDAARPKLEPVTPYGLSISIS